MTRPDDPQEMPPPTLAEIQQQRRWELESSPAYAPPLKGRQDWLRAFRTWLIVWIASLVAAGLMVSFDLHAPGKAGLVILFALLGWLVPIYFLVRCFRSKAE